MDNDKQSLVIELIRTIQLTRNMNWKLEDDAKDENTAAQIRGLVDFLGKEQSYQLTYLLDQVFVYFNELSEEENTLQQTRLES